MMQRLVDRFRINDQVEIQLATAAGLSWQLGRVVSAEYPGLWVSAAETFWFVTNGRRIRRVQLDQEEE